MAAGDTMQGTRVHHPDDVLNGAEPGCYTGVLRGFTADKPAVFFTLPTGAVGHVTSPPHDSIEEHEDGTVTVAPSILHHGGAGMGEAWHGYLERGVWREV